MSSHHLPLEERQRIITLHTDAKRSRTQIASMLHHDLKTVSHWIKHHEEYGDVEDEPRPGRPPKVSVKDKAWIKSKAVRRGWDSTQISNELKRLRRVEVSDRQVRNILREKGAVNRAVRKKHPLTEKEKEKRLAWAKKNIGRNWGRVLFSDYFKIELGSRKKRRWVEKGEFPVEEKKAYPPKLNCWISLSAAGPGKLIVFRQNLTTDLHIDIIREGVPAAARKLFSGNWWLLTDNDPKTLTKRVLDFYEANDIRRIGFPAYTPDGNIAENVIKSLKDRVAKRGARDLQELERFTKDEFKNLPLEIFENLVESMQRRCQDIIDAGGGVTSY
jgi:transposase